MFEFQQSTYISFFGIPGSGKSTLAEALAHCLVNVNLISEPEEIEYPEDICQKIMRREIKGNAIECYTYFRNQRLAKFPELFEQLNINQSLVVDSLYDKMFARLIHHPECKYLIDCEHPDFQEINDVAQRDAQSLPDPGVIIFLEIDQLMHQEFAKKRGRQDGIQSQAFQSQKLFLEQAQMYSAEKGITLITIKQREGIRKSLLSILQQLYQHRIIREHSKMNNDIKPVQVFYNDIIRNENKYDIAKQLDLQSCTTSQLYSLFAMIYLLKRQNEKLFLKVVTQEKYQEFRKILLNQDSQFSEILRKVQNKLTIFREELEEMMHSFLKGQLPDHDMALWLMFVRISGLSTENTIDLTYVLSQTGKIFDFRNNSQLNYKKIIRRYPTGGLSEKIALIMPACIVALSDEYQIASNFLVAKTLGFTGGTWDKLNTIPGFCFPTQEQALGLMQKCGVAISVTNDDSFVPLDRLLYQLRSSTGTIESKPLIVSSIASKQIAIPADHLLMDVRYGEGAFMKSYGEAQETADTMMKIMSQSMDCSYLMTSTNQPSGSSVGNEVEVEEAVQIMKNQLQTNAFWRSEYLQDQKALVIQMLSLLLERVHPRGNHIFYADAIQKKFEDGSVLQGFIKLLESHQVQDDVIQSIINEDHYFTKNYFKYEHPSDAFGTLVKINQELIGNFINFELSTGLNSYVIPKKNGAGMILKVRLDDEIQLGQTLCILLIYTKVYLENNIPLFQKVLSECFIIQQKE